MNWKTLDPGTATVEELRYAIELGKAEQQLLRGRLLELAQARDALTNVEEADRLLAKLGPERILAAAKRAQEVGVATLDAAGLRPGVGT
jgi:hypothetical protein